MAVPLPYSTGYSSRYENIGQMTNQGFDFDLTYTFLDTKEWNAFARTSFSYNWNRVDKLHTSQAEKEGWQNGVFAYVKGKPTLLYSAQFAGYDKEGKQTWYVPNEFNEDGSRKVTNKYSTRLEAPIDYALVDAPFFGGLTLGATWRNQISLTLDFTFRAGAYALNNDRFFYENNVTTFLLTARSKSLLHAWNTDLSEEENANATGDKFGDARQFDDRLIEKTDFFRLKNLTLSYTFPKSLFDNAKVISGAKVFFTGRNLFTLMNKSFNGFDPESAYGVALNRFPTTKQFVGGIQLTF